MKKIIIIIFAVALVAGVLFFVFKKSPTITNYPSKGKTIVAFGDSLVEGVGATTGNDFPSVLEKLIGEPIINMGVSGNISADGLARYEEYFEDIAKIHGALYVLNVLAGLLGNNKFMSDSIHPNNAGYKKIADKIYPVLQKTLK